MSSFLDNVLYFTSLDLILHINHRMLRNMCSRILSFKVESTYKSRTKQNSYVYLLVPKTVTELLNF